MVLTCRLFFENRRSPLAGRLAQVYYGSSWGEPEERPGRPHANGKAVQLFPPLRWLGQEVSAKQVGWFGRRLYAVRSDESIGGVKKTFDECWVSASARPMHGKRGCLESVLCAIGTRIGVGMSFGVMALAKRRIVILPNLSPACSEGLIRRIRFQA